LVERINEEYQNASRWAYINPEVYRGAPVDIDFEIHITRHVTTRTIRSQQYDHINRRMITTYNFNTTRENYGVVNGRTENGRAVVTGLPVSNDPMIGYGMMIYYNDTRGNRTLSYVNTPWHNAERQETFIRYFYFLPDSRNFRVGESVRISLGESQYEWDWNQSESKPVTDGRMLYVMVRDGVLSTGTGSVRGVNVSFTEAAISNAIIYGAYFDGQYVYPISNGLNMGFDSSQRAMEIDMQFDKENYRPGEDVTVRIQAAANTQVLISVVDESSFMWEHTASFRSRLYSSAHRWYFNNYQFASHRQHDFGSAGTGAEGGEGGGDDEVSFREIFTDNPIFELVQTNSNGRGEFTFTLPDQITSWRVTAIALTQDGYAGDIRENIISSLDFYVDLLLTNEYIAGDDIAAAVRAYGGSGAVAFNFSVFRDGERIFTEAQTTPGRAVFNAGKLPEGEYTMQIIATSGTRRDAVELPFSVVQSALIIPNRVTFEISPDDFAAAHPSSFNMRELPVRVSLVNANIMPLTRILRSTASWNSFRTDNIAASAFMDYFYTGETDINAVQARIHARNGGIPELTYEDANFLYTARFVASFPEYADRERILRYLRTDFEDTSVNRAAALLMMAGIGEPVLLQIREEIGNTNMNDTLTVLFLSAALAAIGDDAGAAELAEKIRITRDLTDVQAELANTLLFFINTSVNPQKAWERVSQGFTNQFVSDTPERINFVRRVRLLGDTVSEVQYFLNGETHTARLENFGRVNLHLSHEQFESLNLTPIDGETQAHFNYYGYEPAISDASAENISITRTIAPDGDFVRVTLNVTLPPNSRDFFTIYDRLPSNLRYIQTRERFQNNQPWFSVRNTQRQLIQVHLSAGINQPNNRVITYRAMQLFEGDMADGVTFITNHSNTVWGSTETRR
ncbi:MAG: hypothetical protein LBI27_04265, partial [Clostridiales bacterium]|nr:hypothetical protein [Clostridiales bacterium]